MRKLSRKYYTSDLTENRVPDFNSDTLRSLTETIDSNLKKNGKEDAARPAVSNSTFQVASNDSKTTRKQKPTVALKTSQGKKRLRDGRIKEQSDEKKDKLISISKLRTSNREFGSGNNNNIYEEIRALGGTEEDVDLIANAISESEIEEEEARPSKNLEKCDEKEVLQLVRQLGIDRVAKKELMADSESEEADEVEELEENWNLHSTPPNKELINVNLALQNVVAVGRGQRSLVSKQQCLFFGLTVTILTLALYRFFSLSQSGSPFCYPHCPFHPRSHSFYLLIYWSAYTIMPRYFWNTRIRNTRC